jgi:hypothetical protein
MGDVWYRYYARFAIPMFCEMGQAAEVIKQPWQEARISPMYLIMAIQIQHE